MSRQLAFFTKKKCEDKIKEFGAFIHSEASLELYSTLTMPDAVFCEISLPFSFQLYKK
jgi:hypothetical protein